MPEATGPGVEPAGRPSAARAVAVAPKPGVTKKVRLVVAADPDSLSGKARKARDYGIPIVGEEWLLANLG
ncbi:BRCT domain-containing protein [Microbacterium sp. 67-17]|uniref:BRCT domain-containing protein n=1 Tax=Microbacterium sp. 67-17 TaxID=1895782 RepID=UPI000AE49D76|nr:BRCT domain-containing protein [Microbacterium sp. 67-17]